MTGTVSQRFARMVESGADRPALTFRVHRAWQTWTYAQLAEAMAATTAELRAAGAGAGHAVAVSAQRSPRTVAAMLAALELGAHYVPIDLRDPAPRVAALLATAGCRVLVRTQPPVVESVDTAAAAMPEPSAPGERAAYVMFTSGSTGQPKAVVVPHRAVVRLVTDQECMRLDATRVFLQSVPLSFDASVLELFGALLNGGRCVLFPDDMLPTAEGLRDVVREHGVTTACLTASLFRLLVDRDVSCLRGLHEVVVGGEALPVAHARRALAALPGTQLINGYGPTENGVQTTCHRLPRTLPDDLRRVPIGKPLRGTDVAIVDGQLRPVAPGTPGELLAMGQGLALGYRGDAELTRQRFVQIDLGHGPRRAYRTGDECVQLPGGELDFLGRLDAQVKIGGHRVEPGEVEAVLTALSGVVDARVVARADTTGAQRLCAYVVLGAASLPDVETAVAATLPSFLVPAHFVSVAALPLTANGKLDVAALPSPWPIAEPAPTVPRGERLPLRARVEAAWQEALGRAPAGADVGFFDAGGRSLDAVRLHELLEQACGLSLEATFVYEFPTRRRQIEALGKLLETA